MLQNDVLSQSAIRLGRSQLTLVKTLSIRSRQHKLVVSVQPRFRRSTYFTATATERYRRLHNTQKLVTMSTASKKRKLGEDVQKFYAVKAGKTPGVYLSWAECQENTTGFKGAVCKSLSYRCTQYLCLGTIADN
jgi:hypothetical protein